MQADPVIAEPVEDPAVIAGKISTVILTSLAGYFQLIDDEAPGHSVIQRSNINNARTVAEYITEVNKINDPSLLYIIHSGVAALLGDKELLTADSNKNVVNLYLGSIIGQQVPILEREKIGGINLSGRQGVFGREQVFTNIAFEPEHQDLATVVYNKAQSDLTPGEMTYGDFLALHIIPYGVTTEKKKNDEIKLILLNDLYALVQSLAKDPKIMFITGATNPLMAAVLVSEIGAEVLAINNNNHMPQDKREVIKLLGNARRETKVGEKMPFVLVYLNAHKMPQPEQILEQLMLQYNKYLQTHQADLPLELKGLKLFPTRTDEENNTTIDIDYEDPDIQKSCEQLLADLDCFIRKEAIAQMLNKAMEAGIVEYNDTE